MNKAKTPKPQNPKTPKPLGLKLSRNFKLYSNFKMDGIGSDKSHTFADHDTYLHRRDTLRTTEKDYAMK